MYIRYQFQNGSKSRWFKSRKGYVFVECLSSSSAFLKKTIEIGKDSYRAQIETDMGNESTEETEPQCSFKFHDFVAKIADQTIACHMIKMEDSLYLWIGDSKENAMNDLSFAIESPYEKQPIATKIMGPVANEASINLAKRLSKKLSKAVYVSFNVEVNNLSLPAIERRLQEELNAHPEIL